MSQEQLAEAMEVAPSTISKWEIGKTALSFERVNRLAQILQCERWDLVPGPPGFDLTVRECERIKRMRELGEPTGAIIDRVLRPPPAENSDDKGCI